MALFSKLGNYRNTGLLIVRIGLGVMFILHGYPKLMGGMERWDAIGTSMKNIHITLFPTFFGFMAAITESVGGFLFLLGLAFRPVCFLLAFTMIIASIADLKLNGFMSASHAIELCIVFIGLSLVGPGKYSVDKK